MIGALFALFTIVGGVVTTAATIALVYYIATRRPTPDMRLRDAVTEIRWSYAIVFFVLPCAAVAISDGTPILLGVAYGFSFPTFMVLLTWWSGPI